MSRIRVALVGLSASAKSPWAAKGHLPYLLSPRGQSHYQIVALLNSSLQAAEAAIVAYNLPTTVKAYGDPEALAADPEVDLVVVNTRVDVHVSSAQPSLRAGKGLFIEWPLAENLTQAESMIRDIPASVLKNSITGLQGRVMPLTQRLQSLLAANTIGTVLRSEVRAHGNMLQRDAISATIEYFAERRVGGNAVTILYGHVIDYIRTVLGKWENFTTHAQLQRPTLFVRGNENGEVRKIPTDVPDLIVTHGTLRPSATVAPGATLTATYTTGPSFPGDAGFTWLIAGETGEIKVTASGPFLPSGDSFKGPVTIHHHDFASRDVKEIQWELWPAWQESEGQGLQWRNTGMLYERYAAWVEGGRGQVPEGEEWPTLEDGMEFMREMDHLWKAVDRGL